MAKAKRETKGKKHDCTECSNLFQKAQEEGMKLGFDEGPLCRLHMEEAGFVDPVVARHSLGPEFRWGPTSWGLPVFQCPKPAL